MTKPTLKPCPFCGSKHIKLWRDKKEDMFYIGCRICAVTFIYGFYSEKEASTIWNTRHE